MALSEDQRALLRLLLEGEDYESIATLLGDRSDAVRERAHEALTELDRGDPDLAAARNRIAALDGETPDTVAPGTPAGRGRLAVWLPLAIGALAVAAIIIVVSGVFDGSSDSEPAPAPHSDQEDVVNIPMHAVGGASAKGSARIVRIEDLPAVDIDAVNVDPNGPRETYIVWLYNSPTEAFPLAFLDVGSNGRLEGRTPVPAAATGLLASFDGLDVSLAQKAEAAAVVQQAARGSGIPRHVGRSILRGTFPRGSPSAQAGASPGS
jgi:hypothetical protein